MIIESFMYLLGHLQKKIVVYTYQNKSNQIILSIKLIENYA